jgi:hypothetical protein
MRWIFLAVLAASLVVSWAAFDRCAHDVQASTVLRLDVEDLVARCDVGLEGRVTSKHVQADAKGRIETEYVVRVQRTFWGAALVERTIRLPGGVLPDGRGLVIPGMPTLAEGEVALLFLSAENTRGARMPIGLAQGRLRVVTSATGEKSVQRDVGALELVEPNGAPSVPAPKSALPYDATIARIEAARVLRTAREANGGPR